MKKDVGLILLLSLIALINSEISFSQITKSLSESIKLPDIPKNIDEYVTELRITRKAVKKYKINLDESFYRQVGINKLNYLLAEKIKDTGSPGFEVSLGGEKILIEGGFIDKNILHYYHVSYKVGGNLVQRKKISIDENICHKFLSNIFKPNTEKVPTDQIRITKGDCPTNTKGCVNFKALFGLFKSKSSSCCCPVENIKFIEQSNEEKVTSSYIIGRFGVNIAKKDLLQRVKAEYYLEEEDF